MSKLDHLLQEMRGRQKMFWVDNRVIAKAIKQAGLWGVSYKGVKDDGQDGLEWSYKWYDEDIMSGPLELRVTTFDSAAGPQVRVWLYDGREDIWESRNVKNERDLVSVLKKDMIRDLEEYESEKHRYER